MNVLILGSGGREHAIAWKIAQSSSCNKLYIAPGNGGTKEIGINIDINTTDFDKIKLFVVKEDIQIVIVGPEDPLVKGIYDFFKNSKELQNTLLIGPSMKGAQLEGSKKFAKEFMFRNNIPTANYQSFTKETLEEGYKFLDDIQGPYVLKADGLAAGKGVLIINDLQKAKEELSNMINDKKFGVASETVVIEEFLQGIELSVFVLTDGNNYKILPSAKDYKKIGEGDTGLNTGGMGAISPVPFADRFYIDKVEREIIKPTIEGLKKEGIAYQGFLFIGLINVQGDPKVIEYNVRMGDPETEVVIPRIKSDLLHLLNSIGNGTFSETDLEIVEDFNTTVMLVSKGYPNSYKKGFPISNLENISDSLIFHAGTKIKDNQLITSGGRVIAITSYGKTINEALNKSFENAKKITFSGKYYRKDIGFDL